MCMYCEKSEDLKIEEAYGKNKLVNEEIQLYVEQSHISVDYDNKEASGFYIDINYCPMCGRKLGE